MGKGGDGVNFLIRSMTILLAFASGCWASGRFSLSNSPLRKSRRTFLFSLFVGGDVVVVVAAVEEVRL